MKILLKNPAQIVTVDTNDMNFKRGKDMQDIRPIIGHSIIIEDGLIKDFIPESSAAKLSFDQIIDVNGMIVLPGLIECHTHSAFAGSRANEFLMRLNGASYEEIASKGGGILSTVNAVRTSSFDELVNLLKPRIDYFISQGITAL
jgi:imidazolonepropionase